MSQWDLFYLDSLAKPQTPLGAPSLPKNSQLVLGSCFSTGSKEVKRRVSRSETKCEIWDGMEKEKI